MSKPQEGKLRKVQLPLHRPETKVLGEPPFAHTIHREQLNPGNQAATVFPVVQARTRVLHDSRTSIRPRRTREDQDAAACDLTYRAHGNTTTTQKQKTKGGDHTRNLGVRSRKTQSPHAGRNHQHKTNSNVSKLLPHDIGLHPTGGKRHQTRYPNDPQRMVVRNCLV